LIGVNILALAAQWTTTGSVAGLPPFAHAGLGPFLIGLLLLWLFGDNVEARIGRVVLIVLYLTAGWLSGLGAAGGITAVMGAYFVLLPRSRILVLVPFPVSLVEVPATFFLAVWIVLHVLRFVMDPTALASFVGALALGAVIARVRARRIHW
jgi:membrane associated rhomboid family serine protease